MNFSNFRLCRSIEAVESTRDINQQKRNIFGLTDPIKKSAIPPLDKPLEQREKRVDEILDLLKLIITNPKKYQRLKRDKYILGYLSRLGDTVYGTGESAMYASFVIFNATSATAAGIKGMGSGLRTVIDLGDALKSWRKISERKNWNYDFDKFINKPSKLANQNKKGYLDSLFLGFVDSKAKDVSKETVMDLYNDLKENLLQSKDMPVKELVTKVEFAIELRKYINNIHIRNMGLKYGFVDITSKSIKNKNGEENNFNIYHLNFDKLPEAVRTLKKELLIINNNFFKPNSQVDLLKKDIQNTIKKIQAIGVMKNLNKVNRIRNRIDAGNIASDVFKTTGDALYFWGLLGFMLSGSFSPAGSACIAVGVGLKTTSDMATLIKKRHDLKSEKRIHHEGDEADNKIVENCNELMKFILEPEMTEKFPNTTQIMLESMNKISPKDSIDHTVQEKIIEKFEHKIEFKIQEDEALRKEWDILRSNWESIKTNNTLSQVELDKRSMCENYINQTAEFIMSNILSLTDVSQSRDMDVVIDNLIEYKNCAQFLKVTGLTESVISPYDFIQKTTKANEELKYSTETIANEGVSNLNITKFLDDFKKQHAEMMKNGEKDIDATMQLSQQLQQTINDEFIRVQRNVLADKNTSQIAVMKNMIKDSMMHFL